MRDRRVLHVTEYYPWYSAKVVENLSGILAGDEWSVRILTSNLRVGSEDEETLDVSPVRLERVRSLGVSVLKTLYVLYDPSVVARIVRVLADPDWKPDLIHFHTGHGFLTNLVAQLAQRLEHKPVFVYTSHGIPLGYRSGLMTMAGWVSTLMTLRMIVSKCEIVTTVSRRDLPFWRGLGVPRERLRFIPNGVDTSTFYPSSSLSRRMRTQLGIGEEPVVLFLSQLRAAKGIFDFLAAVSVISEKLPHVKFIVAGDGPLRSRVVEYVERKNLSGRVLCILGYVPDRHMPALFNSCDIYVLPSYVEGMSLALLEALACAKPVVATDIGETPNLVANDVNGYLVAPGSVTELTDRISRLILKSDMRARMSEASREVAKLYDWAWIGREYGDAYRVALDM